MVQEGIPRDAVESHLERILASGHFRAADRSARLLRYIVTLTLDGRGDQLKDYTLGAEALGRGADFDPRTDPIARVEASRLRSRLDAYYATDGLQDAIRIRVPKGAYVPQFERRDEDAPTSTLVAAPTAPAANPAAHRGGWRVLVAAVALLTGAAVLAWWITAAPTRDASREVLRLDMVTPATTDPASLALAPDGRTLAFVASAGDVPRLWLRRLGEREAQPLPGSEYGSWPFWAPDGRAIGFFANGRLHSIDLGTGVSSPVSTAPVPAGASWNRDDVIVHPLVPDSPLFRTTARGGDLEPATALAPGHTGHRGPVFLPDGRRFLFYAAGTPDSRGVHVGQLGSLEIRRLVHADTAAQWLPPATLLYVQNRTLLAQRVDPSSLTLAGEPVTLADDLDVEPGSGLPAITVAASGTIAYRQGPVGARRQLVWIDRDGRTRRVVGDAEERGPAYGAISPDGRRFAVQRTVDGNTDIWLVDLERGPAVRFTSEQRADIAPTWSPRGDRIVYAAQVDGRFELFEKARDDSTPRLLLRDGRAKQVTDWSRDGRYLLYRVVSTTPRADTDIWAMTLDDHRSFAVLATPFEERDAHFSPDGRYIAYQSNESGRHEVYLQPFGGGERLRISAGGGVQARWRDDGRELYYLRPDGQLMAVPIELGTSGGGVRPGAPVPLFEATIGATQGVALHSYSVAPGGQQFLVDALVEQDAQPVRLLIGWHSGPR